LLETLNREMYDAALRWQSLRQPAVDAPYVLVEIDDPSIEALGRFPWSRDVFAEFLTKTTQGRARVVGMDVIFSEAADPEDDRALAEAIARAGNVVLASSAALARPGEAPAAAGAFGELRVAERLLEPIPAFAEVAAAIGHISTLEDSDGAMRVYPALVRYGENPYPSLAQAMAGLSNQAGSSVVLQDDGSILINYGALSPASVARVSLSDVLGVDEVGALRLFSDKIVLVAATYTGGVDVAPTPLATRTPASYAHVYALHTLLSGRSLTPLGGTVPFLFTLIVLAIIAGQIAGHHPLRVAGTAFVTLVVLFGGSAAFFLLGRTVLEPSLPALAIMLFVSGYGLEEWWANVNARRKAEAFLERFMSARIRKRRLDESALDMRAQSLNLAILSVRLSDVGSGTKGMEVTELVELIRSLHQEMVDVVEGAGGTLDRLMGDGLVAYWGYPEAHLDRAARAVQASQDIRTRVLALNDRLGDRFKNRLRVRMGISTGTAVLADVGSEGLADFTILGSFVTLAERLRDTAPSDGVHICQWTYDAARQSLPGTSFEQPAIEADGFDEPVVTYLLERPYRAWADRNERGEEAS
jgi:adenylate cyclase